MLFRSLGNTLGNATPLSSFVSNATGTTINTSAITTTGNQTFNNAVTLGTSTTLTTDTGIINLSNGITGATNNLSLSGGANAQFILGGTLASLGNVTVTGTSSNTLQLSTADQQTWNITSADAGNITNVSGISGTFNFSNIANLTGGSSSNQFIFSNGASVSGNINGGSTVNNTLNYSAYTNLITLILGSTDYVGSVQNNSSATVTNFTNIETVTAPGNSINRLANKPNTIYITGGAQGYINDPIYFNGFVSFIGQGGNTQALFNVPYTTDAAGNFYVNGILMSFSGITVPVTTTTTTTTSASTVSTVISGTTFVYSANQITAQNNFSSPDTSSSNTSTTDNTSSSSTSSDSTTSTTDSSTSSSESSDSASSSYTEFTFSAASIPVSSNINTLLQQQNQIDIKQTQQQSFGCM